jgi:predicted trehalose synthase
LRDASTSPEAGAALQELCLEQRELKGRHFVLRGKKSAAVADAQAASPVRPLRAEQSNTSYIFGESFVGKLVRKVEAGTSAEVEILEALQAGTTQANVPQLIGRVDLGTASGSSTLLTMQAYVSNEGDSWQLTVDHAQRYYEWILTHRRKTQVPPSLGLTNLEQTWEMKLNVMPDFVPLARLLGTRTG